MAVARPWIDPVIVFRVRINGEWTVSEFDPLPILSASVLTT